ncbi:MAG: hypothetical protein R3311_22420, partial [Oceanisphaera sp.]|nr:hypothetical protein [Oceanisphaera sp.]
MIIPGVAGRIAKQADEASKLRFENAMHLLGSVDQREALDTPMIRAAAVRGWCLRDNDTCCAISGNIDWLQNEFADVQLRLGPAQALLAAYRSLGLDLLRVVGGRFSLFLWDGVDRSGLIASDRFGQMPVYWAEATDDALLFGPTATVVSRLLEEHPRLSEQAIYNYLYFHMVPGPATVFEGVNKLLAGHALVAVDGQWRVRRYWQPNFRENADASMHEASEELMGLLSSSV